MANRITTLFELDSKNFDDKLRKLKKDVSEAETPFQKLKVAGSGAFDAMKENVGAMALAAGAALTAFAVKSVQAFTESGLAAGKFSDATGLAVEDASRWLEVAGDIGISGETVTGMFTRLNKSIGENNPAVKALGIEMQHTADGAVDMNATMLQAIDAVSRIEDPTERARRAQQLFGRGYAEAAELIFNGADRVSKKLAEVSDAKVIDEEELAKARDMREAMDNLKDAVEDVQLAFGEFLAPAITDNVNRLVKFKGAVEDVIETVPGVEQAFSTTFGMILDPIGTVQGAIEGVKDELKATIDVGTAWDGITQDMAETAKEAAEAVEGQASALELQGQYAEVGEAKIEANRLATERKKAADDRAKVAAERHADAEREVADAMDRRYDATTRLIGGDIALRQAQRDAADAAALLKEQTDAGFESMTQASAAIDVATEAQIGAAQAAVDYAEAQANANGQQLTAAQKNQLMAQELTKLAANLDGPMAAALLRYIELLRSIPTNINTRVTANGTPTSIPIQPGSAYAEGTSSAKAGLALVGEKGPELVQLSGGERIYTANETGKILGNKTDGGVSLGGGGGISLTVNAGLGADGRQIGRQIVDILEAYARGGGQLPPSWARRLGA